jgi:predicted secreted protein
MCTNNQLIPDINVTLDTIFSVRLEKNGGTGYVWALAHMPESVNLIEISLETTQSNICGHSQTQVFTFAAVAVDQSSISFNLIRPWEPEVVADKKSFALIITEKESLENDLEDTAGCRKFVTFSPESSGSIMSLYMGQADTQFSGLPTMKYMAPPLMKYMGPPIMKYMAPSAADCTAKPYMAPVKIDDNDCGCNK